jgi:hypothetical protein
VLTNIQTLLLNGSGVLRFHGATGTPQVRPGYLLVLSILTEALVSAGYEGMNSFLFPYIVVRLKQTSWRQSGQEVLFVTQAKILFCSIWITTFEEMTAFRFWVAQCSDAFSTDY